MRSQKDLIESTEWDNLIILDACRYDYFESNYEKYLDGELKEVESEGHRTKEWLEETWDGKHDLTYISANPYINSMGIDRGLGNFNPVKHFDKIEDLWKEEWDQCLETVLPKRMTFRGINQYSKNPNRKYVFHYMQPHFPFLSIGPLQHGVSVEEPLFGYGRKAMNYIVDKLGNKKAVEMRKALASITDRAKNEYEVVAETYGVDGLRMFYRKNLEFALESVSKLVSKIEGKTIVTSDHGDYLGEEGKYGHEVTGDIFLREIPWMMVN